MKFTETGNSERFSIRAYAAGRIQVGGAIYRGSLIVTPRQVLPDWPPAHIDALTAEHLDAVVALAPEVLLLGTGTTQIFPDPALYAALLARRIGLEVMDTRAACRTYNILLAEDRWVVAALIMI